MSSCTHSTCETPFCPWCGQPIIRTLTTQSWIQGTYRIDYSTYRIQDTAQLPEKIQQPQGGGGR